MSEKNRIYKHEKIVMIFYDDGIYQHEEKIHSMRHENLFMNGDLVAE